MLSVTRSLRQRQILKSGLAQRIRAARPCFPFQESGRRHWERITIANLARQPCGFPSAPQRQCLNTTHNCPLMVLEAGHLDWVPERQSRCREGCTPPGGSGEKSVSSPSLASSGLFSHLQSEERPVFAFSHPHWPSCLSLPHLKDPCDDSGLVRIIQNNVPFKSQLISNPTAVSDLHSPAVEGDTSRVTGTRRGTCLGGPYSAPTATLGKSLV